MPENSLEKAIISTICYFDVFDFPLTSLEICKWLYFENDAPEKKYGLLDVINILESDNIKNSIETKSGFYFLKGREEIILSRLKRYNLASRKFLKAISMVKIFRFFPFIKMVAVCNTLAYSNAREDSDIDLFIVAQKGRVWTCRFFISAFAKLFRLRPSGENTKNKICLSFFVAEDNLNLESLKINTHDPHFVYWVSQITSIYDPNNIFDKFWRENKWIKKQLPNIWPNLPVKRRSVSDNVFSVAVKHAKRLFLSLFAESMYKNLQLKIMPEKIKAMANRDSRVVVRDDLLKFHDIDRREEFNGLFQKKLISTENEQ